MMIVLISIYFLIGIVMACLESNVSAENEHCDGFTYDLFMFVSIITYWPLAALSAAIKEFQDEE